MAAYFGWRCHALGGRHGDVFLESGILDGSIIPSRGSMIRLEGDITPSEGGRTLWEAWCIS